MIELKNVYKQVGTDEAVVKILQNISLTINKGEFIGIMGPSGSGKSTLMNIIGFLDVANSGTYIFKGKDISKLNEDHLALYRSTEVGFVFQAFNLLPKTSVYHNVKMPLMYHPHRASESDQVKKVNNIIKSVGLSHRRDHLSNQLSGGEKQRVAIARALINDPAIILADEPTGNLDSKSGIEIMKILENLNKHGKTIILVTHEQMIAEHAHRILVLRDGKIESDKVVQLRRKATSTGTIK
jgi:putative ABC transport system ATP-binding protein